MEGTAHIVKLKCFRMERKNNTDRYGNEFSESIKRQVWEKARIVPGVDPKRRRLDICGAWIEWNQYGVTKEYRTGWEIDHIKPIAKGGTDDVSNLQPLQWQNNRKKADRFPAFNYQAVTIEL